MDLHKLNKFKENSENNTRIFEENMDRAEKTFEKFEQMKKTYAETSTTLHDENQRREEIFERYYNSLNELNQSRAQLAEIYSEIEKLKTTSGNNQKEISDLISQKNTLDSKIPQLEKEKKAYATARNFKEASRVSNEIKEMQARVDEINAQLEQLQSEEKNITQMINTVSILL